MKINKTTGIDGKSFSLIDYIIIALLLGVLWGFFEVVFKDVLLMGGKPLTAGIMTGVGVMIMAIGFGFFKQPGMALGISAFTILTRMIIVPVLGCSPLCRANAVLALLLLGAFTSAAFGLSARIRKPFLYTGGAGIGAGVLLSGISFYHAGLACAPCQYLSNFQNAGGITAFFTAEIIYWVAFSVLLFYPGYIAGRMLRQHAVDFKITRPLPYYAGIISASVAMIILTGLIVMP